MRYSGDELAEIAEKIDIVDYISQTEELHRMGQYYTTRCCFHEGDDTPSLRVYPAAGFVRYFKGRYLVVINKEATSYDSNCDLVFNEDVATVIKNIK